MSAFQQQKHFASTAFFAKACDRLDHAADELQNALHLLAAMPPTTHPSPAA